MRNSRVRVAPESDARSWSRREVLARGAGVASLWALPQLWIPQAWGQTQTFDYYISPTGSDNNPGTLAAPWALTSFIQGSANNNLMGGKRIGLVAGNYSITSAFPETSNFQSCKLTVPGGTKSNPTYVASCSAAGVYSARAATITWAGGSTTANALMGNGNFNTDQMYIVIDGLRINGNGVASNANGNGHIIQFYNTTDSNYRVSSNYATLQGIVVQNCELWNINPGYNGGNYACIAFITTVGAVAQNNLLHDVIVSGAGDASHHAGTLEIGCYGNQYLYNTIYNTPGGIWVKEGSTSATAAYNYFYNVANTSADIAGYCSAFVGWDGSEGSPNTGPGQLYVIHHNVIEGGCAHKPVGGEGPVATAISCNVYNNTVYDTQTAGNNGWLLSAYGCNIEYYNNIYMTTAGSSGSSGGAQNGKIYLNAGLFSTTNYNCYFSATGSYSNFYGMNQNNYPNFGAWQAAVQASAAGSESHSLNANPTFSTSSPSSGAGAAQYQLAGNSPCLNSGRVSGAAAGGVCNIGAWDGTTSQIGCNFAPGSTGTASLLVPNPPTLTVK